MKKTQREGGTKKATKKVMDESVVETWNHQHTLKTHAMDRSYKTVMSVSPLKHRVEFDMDVSPSRRQLEQRSTTPRRSLSRGRSGQKMTEQFNEYQTMKSPSRADTYKTGLTQ